MNFAKPYDQKIINFFKDSFYLIDTGNYYDVIHEAYNQFGDHNYSQFLIIIDLIQESCNHELPVIKQQLLQVWGEI